MLREARLTKKEQEALNRSLRVSKRRPKSTLIVQDIPPYVLLPLLPYVPREFIVWDSTAGKQGFLAETITGMRGNVVIESDPMEFLRIPPKLTAQVQIAHPPTSLLHEWIARSYDNHQAFALLMPFDVWATSEAQAMFQRFGVSVIILNRPIHLYTPKVGWKVKTKMAWFTYALPGLQQLVTYGHIPLEKHLPTWMMRPAHKREITKGAKSMEDRLAIRHATNPHQWPASKGGR